MSSTFCVLSSELCALRAGISVLIPAACVLRTAAFVLSPGTFDLSSAASVLITVACSLNAEVSLSSSAAAFSLRASLADLSCLSLSALRTARTSVPQAESQFMIVENIVLAAVFHTVTTVSTVTIVTTVTFSLLSHCKTVTLQHCHMMILLHCHTALSHFVRLLEFSLKSFSILRQQTIDKCLAG